MDTFNYQEFLRKNPLLENINESEGDVKAKWSTLSDDQKIDLLTAVWDDSDEAEKHFEKEWDDLPEAAKANMRMDMLREDNSEDKSLNDDHPFMLDKPSKKYIQTLTKELETARNTRNWSMVGGIIDDFHYLLDTKPDTLGEGALMDEYSDLADEKQMMIEMLTLKMKKFADENPSELTRDFLNRIVNFIEDMKMSDF